MSIQKRSLQIAVLLLSLSFTSCSDKNRSKESAESFSGSLSCKQCHEHFYELWEPSLHGKAMQPTDIKFVREYQLPTSDTIKAGEFDYQIIYQDSMPVMAEFKPNAETVHYPIEWSLGGRNVFTFLVSLNKGRLQTIPLAYDLNRKEWFNYPESAIRHFSEVTVDEELPWKDRMYTFNTGCYNCHVSQLSSNFDTESETYHTTWRESGINCETCHGPSGEHVKVFMEAKEGEVPDDIKIITTSTFTPEQHNASCASCHAKVNPITTGYIPGEPFYDHFNLAALEDPDFYPDGIDLGENYTMTGWKMNPCQAKSDLHCVTCHTSSGRNRFENNPNKACTQCHTERERDLTKHTMHAAESTGSLCVNCHMPSREFVGHFIRSDHSFRPPMPESTIKFGSPNGCNLCHTDRSAQWANEIVKKRANGNYQQKTIYWAELIDEARKSRWDRLEEMLQIIDEQKHNEIVEASLIRLLVNCTDNKKWPHIIDAATKNRSPLVRAAAASALSSAGSKESVKTLAEAANDKYRLVRISAAASLAGSDKSQFSEAERIVLKKATDEYMESLLARPDNWSSHYNLALYHQNEGEIEKALTSYETAARLYPEALVPLINSSVLYSYMGNRQKAEENLQKVISKDPDNEAGNLNYGLLLAEQGRFKDAESSFRKTLKINPEQPTAAYNLSVITAQNDLEEAIKYAKIAAEAVPDEPKYAYTVAYYLFENRQTKQAIETLKQLISENPNYISGSTLLAQIYIQEGNRKSAEELLKRGIENRDISNQNRGILQQALNEMLDQQRN